MKFDRTGVSALVFASDVFTLCVQIALAIYLQDFMLFSWSGDFRIWALLLSTTPALFFFSLIALASGPVISCVLVNGATLVLSLANQMKLSLTQEPLTGSDLTEISNITIAWHYMKPQQVLLVCLVLLASAIAIKFAFCRTTLGRQRIKYLLASIFLAPFIFYPWLDLISEGARFNMEAILRKGKIFYMPSDLARNVQLNGLPLHLIQTSSASPIPTVTESERREFLQLVPPSQDTGTRDLPSNVIIVECESFWHGEGHFESPFKQLEELGLKPLRAISPAYGGGTVNASFELLTGLPAHGPLDGMIYQEYASQFAPEAMTLARSLRRKGYRPTAIHPYLRRFWRRDVVLPKFGFERFVSIEDMDYTGPMRWADDALLYRAALSELSTNPKNNFLYLTTVYTHGWYRFQNDYGEADYLSRLTLSLQRLADFIREVQRIAPDSLVLIIADHKPSLSRYFFEKGIIPASEFLSTGERDDEFQFTYNSSDALRGDVPAYLFYRDSVKAREFIARANSKPFFCVSEILDDVFLKSGLPAFEYARSRGLCSTFDPPRYKQLVAEYPSWLYALSLFEVP